jgi:hypothetical protein
MELSNVIEGAKNGKHQDGDEVLAATDRLLSNFQLQQPHTRPTMVIYQNIMAVHGRLEDVTRTPENVSEFEPEAPSLLQEIAATKTDLEVSNQAEETCAVIETIYSLLSATSHNTKQTSRKIGRVAAVQKLHSETLTVFVRDVNETRPVQGNGVVSSNVTCLAPIVQESESWLGVPYCESFWTLVKITLGILLVLWIDGFGRDQQRSILLER